MRLSSTLMTIALFYIFSTTLIAQTATIEISDKNINLAYFTENVSQQYYAFFLDTSLLYTKFNKHQDFLAGIGFHFIPHKHSDNHLSYAVVKVFVSPPPGLLFN